MQRIFVETSSTAPPASPQVGESGRPNMPRGALERPEAGVQRSRGLKPEDCELAWGCSGLNSEGSGPRLRRLRTSEWCCIPKTPNFGVGLSSEDSGLSSEDYGLNSEDSELRSGLHSEDSELRSEAKFRRLRAKLRRLRAKLRRLRTSEWAKFRRLRAKLRKLRTSEWEIPKTPNFGVGLNCEDSGLRSEDYGLNCKDYAPKTKGYIPKTPNFGVG